MTSGDLDDGRNGSSQPWHNRTPAVLGASVLALAVVGILVLAITYMSRQFGEPEQAPLNFVEPTYSATAPRSGTATTQTITSTSPPQTTEIGGPLDPSTTPSTSTSPSTTSSSETTSESPTVEEDEDEASTERTTRRPRTNVTRTSNPFR